jgi:cytochrome P450
MARPKLPATIPGPAPHWLFGWRGTMLSFADDPLGKILEHRRRYGDVFALVQGGNAPLNSTVPGGWNTVFALRPEFNQQLLSDPVLYHSSILLGTDGTRYFRLGTGLLNMNGDKHRQQRRLMMPAFHRKRIEAYADQMVALTTVALESWKVGERRDLLGDMRDLTLRIASKVLFGMDVDPQAGGLAFMIDEWLKLSGTLGVMFFPWDIPFTPYHRFMRASAHLETALKSIIAAKRAHGADEGDVLSLLVHTCEEDGTKMSEDELIGQANLLFLAGHETTANALTWTLFLLAQHPTVMRDLLDELTGVLHGAPPTVPQLAELPLLERIIKESMRLCRPCRSCRARQWPRRRWVSIRYPRSPRSSFPPTSRTASRRSTATRSVSSRSAGRRWSRRPTNTCPSAAAAGCASAPALP